MLLGMKGAMSELELSILRQRSLEALRQKAKRGELFLTVAVGYVKVRHDRIEKDPDRRVQEALQLVFRKFAEFQSIRQVHLWLRQERIVLPAVNYRADQGRQIDWKLPVYNTVHHILTNPIYAGAYVFGRTGRKRVVRGFRKVRQEWEVLLVDHHEGYLSWAEFERNQRLIADNTNSKGMMVRGSVRRGETLLAGMLRCGHCGRNLHVAYSGANGDVGRYHCRGALINHGGDRCISFGSRARRSSRQKCTMQRPTRDVVKQSWRLSRLGTRRPVHGDSTMPSIPTIDSLPQSSSTVGTSDSLP